MSRLLRRIRRRRGQGMTEYIIAVGLIAILLTVVVERYKNQIEVTIVGNDKSKGMTGEISSEVTSNIPSGGSKGKPQPQPQPPTTPGTP